MKSFAPPPPRRLLPAFLVALAAHLPAQVSISTLGTALTENFDTLGTAASAPLPSHWQISAAGDATITWDDSTNFTATNLQASTNSPTTGGRYNWGQSATDRAIGFMTSSNYASPNNLLVGFSNATGSTIHQLSLSFDYERYRLNTSAASINFFHSSDGATWTAATSGDSSAFSTGTNTYGFDPLISSDSKSVTLTSLNFQPGASFYLRWQFDTTGTNSQGLGLDNFSLTASAVPEPSTYAALAGAAALLGAAWHRRRRPASLSTEARTPG